MKKIQLINKEIENQLPTAMSEQIRSTFLPMADAVEQIENEFNAIISKEIDESASFEARELRLKIQKMRTSAESVKKQLKANILLQGKAIDGAFNILKLATSDKEAKLLEIEKHQELQKQKRKKELQEQRVELIKPYFESDISIDFSGLSDEAFNAMLDGYKTAFARKKQAEEDARKAEEERIERERAEQERIRKENEALKAEQERLTKERAEAEAKAKAEREALELKARKERAEAEAKAKAEREAIELKARKEREALEAKLAEEKRKAAEVEKQRLAKEQAELKERAEAEAEEQKRLSAPDEAKANELCKNLNNLSIPEFKTDKFQKIGAEVEVLISKIVDHIVKKMEEKNAKSN